MANNFKCNTCGKEFAIVKSRTAVAADGKIVNKDFNNNILVCDVDNTPLQSISKFDGEAPYFAKVGSMSNADRKEVLQKRSKAHFQKEIKEKATEMDNEMKRGLLGK